MKTDENLKIRTATFDMEEHGLSKEVLDSTGSGIIPFKTIVENLNQISYDGNLSIEHFDIENQLESMAKSADFLKSLTKFATIS